MRFFPLKRRGCLDSHMQSILPTLGEEEMPVKAQPMSDLLVIIPGITGLVLCKDGKEVWGLSAGSIIGNLLSLGENVKQLQLPEGLGHNEPHDGVEATRLMPDLHLLPGLWSIDGYSKLLEDLRRRFTLTDYTDQHVGNLLLFPYDWRLSNIVSAKRLAKKASQTLERWRTYSHNPDAKLILICHSMGGLVARWFLEMESGREITRRLLTIGTPYQGSINALDNLVNGFSKGLGPLRVNLTELVRSFPSTYQLLPTFPSIDVGNGLLQKLTEISVPNLELTRVKEAASFHQRISDAVQNDVYDLTIIKGHVQPTAQSARITGNQIEPLRMYKDKNVGGDGTVPRPSSHPPEWTEGDAKSIFAAQIHGSLQNTDGVLEQLYGVLTGHLGQWMGAEPIGLDIPSIVNVREALPIVAISDAIDETLALQAVVEDESGEKIGDPQLLNNAGQGRYEGECKGLPPGSYRITVESAVSQRPVEAVTAITIVWDDVPISE